MVCGHRCRCWRYSSCDLDQSDGHSYRETVKRKRQGELQMHHPVLYYSCNRQIYLRIGHAAAGVSAAAQEYSHFARHSLGAFYGSRFLIVSGWDSSAVLTGFKSQVR